MIDPELQHYLSGINQNLTEIKNKKQQQGIWRSFFNGMFSALGYVVGIAIVVILLGWFLNKTGILPEFQKQAKNFQGLMISAQKLLNVGDTEQGSNQSIQKQGDVYTLPDGTKVQIVK